MTSQTNIDIENLEWLVKRRGSVHTELFQLLKYIDMVGVESLAVGCEERRNVFASLVGVGFSLWRAAFLTDLRPGNETRDWKTVLVAARGFLHVLVRDNNINFTQDRAFREWGSGTT